MKTFKDVPLITKLTPLSLIRNYEDDNGNQDFGVLSWSVRNGYPRVSVFTKNKNINKAQQGFDYGAFINAPFNHTAMQNFIQLFRAIINGKKDSESCVKCMYPDPDTKENKLKATVYVGKDEDGVIYLKCIEQGKRQLRFDILPDKFHYYEKDTGKMIDDKETLSKLHSRSYIRLLEDMLKVTYIDLLKYDLANPRNRKNSNNFSNKKSNNDQQSQPKENDSNKDVDNKLELSDDDMDNLL